MYQLKEVYIKDFRGFREERIKLPEADIILLLGNNGMGKTSFFDAVEWGFTGSLKRYEPSSQEKNQEIFLTNKYAEANGQVQLILEDEKKRTITIKRETYSYRGNDFNEGQLTISGKDNETISDLLIKDGLKKDFDFNAAFNFSHLLCQELISSFVRNYKGTERYTLLSNLVGVQNYTDYRDQINFLRRECQKKIENIADSLDHKEKKQIRLEGKLNKEKINEKELEQTYKELLRKISTDDEELLKKEIFSEDVFKLDIDQALKHISSQSKSLTDSLFKFKKRAAGINGLQNSIVEYEKSIGKIDVLKERIKSAKLSFLAKFFSERTTLQGLKNTVNCFDNYIKKKEDLLEIIDSNYKDLEKINRLKEKDKGAVISYLSKLQEEMEENLQEINGLDEETSALTKKIKDIENMQINLLVAAQDYFKEGENVDHCPVCLSSIDLKEVIAGLKERLELAGSETGRVYRHKLKQYKTKLEKSWAEKKKTEDKIMKALDKYKDIILDRVKRAQQKKEKHQDELKIQQKCVTYLNELKLKHNVSAINEKLEDVEQIEFDNYQEVEEIIAEARTEISIEEKVVNGFKTNLKNLEVSAINELDKTYHNITNNINSLDLKIKWLQENEDKLKEIDEKIKQSTNRQKLEEINKEIIKSKNDIEYMEEKVQKLKVVEKRVPELINDMMENILNPYKELANQIYRKINPQPFFNIIDWERDSTGSNNPTLVLKVKSADGQQANPSYIYSAAQVNIIVLSLFMSFVIQNNWSKLNAFFLDDPVQSMDDINIFSFVDVLRSIYLNSTNPQQLFISTHDQKLYAFFKKKFRMFNVCTIGFKSYGKNGPVIDMVVP